MAPSTYLVPSTPVGHLAEPPSYTLSNSFFSLYTSETLARPSRQEWEWVGAKYEEGAGTREHSSLSISLYGRIEATIVWVRRVRKCHFYH